VRRHGRVNTCAGCLPKVTGVQKSPKVAAETAAEGKFLTVVQTTNYVNAL